MSKESSIKAAEALLQDYDIRAVNRYHWQLTLSNGAVVEIWPSTGKWQTSKDCFGDTIDGLMDYLRSRAPKPISAVEVYALCEEHLIKYKNRKISGTEEFDAEASYKSLLHHLCASGCITNTQFKH